MIFVLAGRVSIRECLHPRCHQCWPLHGHHVATKAPHEQTPCQDDHWYCVVGGAGNSSAYPAAFKPEPAEHVAHRVWPVCLRGEMGQLALPLLLHVSPCCLLQAHSFENVTPFCNTVRISTECMLYTTITSVLLGTRAVVIQELLQGNVRLVFYIRALPLYFTFFTVYELYFYLLGMHSNAIKYK